MKDKRRGMGVSRVVIVREGRKGGGRWKVMERIGYWPYNTFSADGRVGIYSIRSKL